MKTCSACKVTKELSNFTTKASNKDGLQDKCKACKREYNKRYYEKTKERHNPSRLKRTTQKRTEAQMWAISHLRGKICVDCKTPDWRVFDFDHVHGKYKNVSELIHSGASVERLEAEAAKCEIVCANCHRIRTYERSGKCYRM